jgi:ATP synthase I chain
MTAPPEENGDDPRQSEAQMRAAITSVFFSGLCLAVAALAFFGVKAGLSALLGGILATLNLYVFARVGQAFMERKGNTAPWGLVAVLKLLVLFGGVWFVLKSGMVSALGLAAGYASLPLGVTIASLFGPKPPEADPPPRQSARRGRDVIQGPRAGHDDSDPEL